MQKTVGINGRRYDGKQVARLMDKSGVTDDSGLVKFIKFGRFEYACEYRDNQGYYAPIVKHREEANAIKMQCMTYQGPPKWLVL